MIKSIDKDYLDSSCVELKYYVWTNPDLHLPRALRNNGGRHIADGDIWWRLGRL
jgi:hypothetical protein